MVKDWEFSEMRDRRIWIPYMCDSAFLLAAALRGKGYDSDVLPRSEDPLLTLGRRYTDGDQCLPSIITTEDILTRVFSQDFNAEGEAFFQGKSEGPCRFGRYYMNQSLILEKLGLDNVPIVTLDNKNFYGGLGTDFKILAWNGVLGQGMLERMLHFTRPLELREGESERVYWRGIKEFAEILETKLKKGIKKTDILSGNHNIDLLESLQKTYNQFLKVEKRQEQRPVIFVTGEIFVRTSSVANQNLIKRIEDLGGIALLEPTASFFSYIIAEKMQRRKHHVRDLRFKDRLKYGIELHFVERDGEEIEDIFKVVPHDPEAREVIKRGSKYVHSSFIGEAIITLGGCDYFAKQGVDGIINVLPHECMPGTICTAKSLEIRDRYNVAFLNLSYDGHMDPNRDEQLEVFMYQVRERQNKKREKTEES